MDSLRETVAATPRSQVGSRCLICCPTSTEGRCATAITQRITVDIMEKIKEVSIKRISLFLFYKMRNKTENNILDRCVIVYVIAKSIPKSACGIDLF